MTSLDGKVVPSPATSRLHAILDREWERTLTEFPLLATELGDRRHNSRWPDVALESLERRHREDQRALAELEAIQPAGLSSANQLNLELFRKNLETAIEEFQFSWYLLPLTAREGIQDASSVADAVVFESASDYEDWIERMRQFPVYMEQTIRLMREGISTRMVHPKVVMERVPAQIRRQITELPDESPFFKPFTCFANSVPEFDRNRLANEARAQIRDAVVPAYKRMLEFFTQEYLPGCTEDVGAWQLPKGAELYQFFARKFTATRYSPAEIHEIGQSEVRRLRASMEQIIKELRFEGTWDAFLEHLRTAPRFYCASADELTRAYEGFCRRVDGQLPRLFRRLPLAGYNIQPIPANIAPDTTTAYYRPPSADGRRPGTYFINLYRPEARPLYEIPALSLHEAVPGHHLQIARTMELEGLPAFRRFAPEGSYTAYVEGWALYAEALGDELGCYNDPYDKFGQLTYEMWRAVRLVVDTGLHAFRWRREQAIDYFLEHTAKARLDIENEVDRYIAWPGQALAYKIGELEIKRLRHTAESELGTAFDLRDFHEVILSNGPLPLEMLDPIVSRWLQDVRAANKTS